MGRGPSIIERLMRRGRKEKEEATDDRDHPTPPGDPQKEPTKDPEAGTDTTSGDAAGDVLTISEGAGAGGDDANVSSDDASDTDGDVLTVGDGSAVIDDGSDDVVSADEGDGSADKTPPSDEPPEEPGTDPGDPDTGTGNDTETGTATDDSSDGVVGEDDASQDSDVTNNDGSGVVDDNANVATGDGTQTGDVVDDANVVTGDGNQQAIDDNATGVTDGAQDSDIDTGQGTGDPADVSQTPQHPIDLSLVRNARIGGPKDSSLSDDLQELKEATEPQLDPAVIEARLGGKGPPSPDPDDTPDDLAFGKGATLETQQPTGSVLVNVDPEVPAEAPEGVPDDGLTDVGQELNDTGLDAVGGAPPDDGFGPHDVRIDDTTPQNEPTEVDID